MRIDIRQHDLVIANGDDGVAVLLPDVEISLIELPAWSNSSLSTPSWKSVIVA